MAIVAVSLSVAAAHGHPDLRAQLARRVANAAALGAHAVGLHAEGAGAARGIFRTALVACGRAWLIRAWPAALHRHTGSSRRALVAIGLAVATSNGRVFHRADLRLQGAGPAALAALLLAAESASRAVGIALALHLRLLASALLGHIGAVHQSHAGVAVRLPITAAHGHVDTGAEHGRSAHALADAREAAILPAEILGARAIRGLGAIGSLGHATQGQSQNNNGHDTEFHVLIDFWS